MQGTGAKPPNDLSDTTWWVRDLVVAARFLTRLPTPAIDTGDRKLMRASWCFPVVGAGIGCIGGLAAWLGQSLGLPIVASALLAIAATASRTSLAAASMSRSKVNSMLMLELPSSLEDWM